MKKLVVAEKPSVGRDIARVLQCRQKGEGYLHSDTHIVSWAIGHLATLCEPEDYDESLKKWTMESLPILPETMRCKAITKTRAQLTVLRKLMTSAEVDSIVCATDSGREGELIFRYIYDMVRCKKPFKRLWISSMTDAAIKDGFARMKDGSAYDNLYASAKCRSEADWLVGMNATRAYTVKYGVLLSVGRVQTPTLALLVERQREIDAFVPEDYWEVLATFLTERGEAYTGIWFEKTQQELPTDPEGKFNTRIKSAKTAQAIADRVKKQKGTVQSVTTEEKRLPPPQLFDLTELQRECNRKLSFSAQKTLSIAQDLYEKHKMITYPRTDSRYISNDMVPKLPSVAEALNFEPYGEAVAYLQGLPELPVTKRIADDSKVTDHHAIIPTESLKKYGSLTPDERSVFDLIARKFLAAFFPAYIYDVTTVITAVGSDKFVSKGRTVKQEGWTVLYKHERQTIRKNVPNRQQTDNDYAQPNIDGDEPLPDLKNGSPVQVSDAEVLHKKTQPPKPYTEATLLSAMEHASGNVPDEKPSAKKMRDAADSESLLVQMNESGLGTPATRAAIIERLLQVGYIVRKQKSLIPTEKGVNLIAVVPEALRSPETTGKWERGLVRIANGEMEAARFMESIQKYVRFIVEDAITRTPIVAEGEPPIAFPKEESYKKGRSKKYQKGKGGTAEIKSICACPLCGGKPSGGQVMENSKAFYCSRWKEGCKMTIWKSTLAAQGKAVDVETVRAICEGMNANRITR